MNVLKKLPPNKIILETCSTSKKVAGKFVDPVNILFYFILFYFINIV